VSNKIRTTIIALVASASIGAAALAPAVSQAEPNKTSPKAGCPARDATTGEYVEVKDGTLEISAGGNVMQCQNGKWVTVGRTASPVTTPPVATTSPPPAL
jgi:hypothetical protein